MLVEWFRMHDSTCLEYATKAWIHTGCFRLVFSKLFETVCLAFATYNAYMRQPCRHLKGIIVQPCVALLTRYVSPIWPKCVAKLACRPVVCHPVGLSPICLATLQYIFLSALQKRRIYTMSHIRRCIRVIFGSPWEWSEDEPRSVISRTKIVLDDKLIYRRVYLEI